MGTKTIVGNLQIPEGKVTAHQVVSTYTMAAEEDLHVGYGSNHSISEGAENAGKLLVAGAAAIYRGLAISHNLSVGYGAEIRGVIGGDGTITRTGLLVTNDIHSTGGDIITSNTLRGGELDITRNGKIGNHINVGSGLTIGYFGDNLSVEDAAKKNANNTSRGITVGESNTGTSLNSVISGRGNVVSGENNIIGGTSNEFNSDYAPHGNVVGGTDNNIYCTDSIVGGTLHDVYGKYHLVVGYDNSTLADSTDQNDIIGGILNEVHASNTIVTGTQNKVGNRVFDGATLVQDNAVNYSIVVGSENHSLGNYTGVVGDNNSVGITESSFVAGKKNSLVHANYAAMFGYNNTIGSTKDPNKDLNCNGCFVSGNNNETLGLYSITFGNQNHNNGQYTFVNGMDATVDRGVIHSMVNGKENSAKDTKDTNGHDASWSFVNGYRNIVAHRMNFVSGVGLKSSAKHQTTLGRFNTSSSSALFVVGNGSTGDEAPDGYTGETLTTPEDGKKYKVTRSNAFEVLNDGSVKLGGTTLTEQNVKDLLAMLASGGSSGGSGIPNGYTEETWTFTDEDGTTITRTVLCK